MTLAALVAALSSAACSVHISTGPSSAAYRSGPTQPNGLVWASAPRPPREHRDPAPPSDQNPPDRDAPEQQRPNRQFDAADEMMRDAAAQRTPRRLEPTRRTRDGKPGGIKDREVVTVGTSSHTGNGPQQPPPRDVGPWVNNPGSGHTPSDGPQVAGQDSGGKPAATPASSLPRGDGRLQRISKNKR